MGRSSDWLSGLGRNLSCPSQGVLFGTYCYFEIFISTFHPSPSGNDQQSSVGQKPRIWHSFESLKIPVYDLTGELLHPTRVLKTIAESQLHL